MLAEERREQFKADVAQMKLRTGRSRLDVVLQVLGALMMVAGTAAAFITYEASSSQNDPRDIASQQILAISFLALVVVGSALFLFGSVARFLRLWLLRQLYEGQAHVEQLVSALRPEK